MISDHGRVLSLYRTVIRSNGLPLSVKQKVLKAIINKDGYGCVWICGNKVLIHQLVIKHFISDNPSIYHEPNHKDGVKSNNHYRNLEWVTKSENYDHARRNGLLRPKKGINHHNSKLTDDNVIFIRSKYGEYSQTQLASMFCVGQNTISGIVNRKSWRHI